MGELRSLKKVNNLRQLTPFMEYISFGEKRSDGIYKLYHTTTMNGAHGGYQVDAIFGVLSEKKLDDYDDYTIYDEHIFVGECPHKNENGEWVTYNDVPHFIQYSYNYKPLNIEYDIPFIVRVIPELNFDEIIKKNEFNDKMQLSKIYELQQQIDRCTFKMYMKGLWNRIKSQYNGHLHFVSYTGERTYHFGIKNPSNEFEFCYWNDFKKGEKYFCKVTDKMVTRWTFYKDGKLTWKKDSWENDHVYCSC